MIGIGENGEHFMASDATPIVEHTKNVVYLEDGEIAVIERGKGLKIRNVKNQEKTPFIHGTGDAPGGAWRRAATTTSC